MLREINPAAEHNIAETRAELAEEAELLDRLVLEALAGCRSRCRRGAIAIGATAGWEPGLRRLALRALAERAAGRAGAARPPPRRGDRAPGAERPRAARSSSAAGPRDLRGGLVRFTRRHRVDAAPEPVTLRSRAAPGSARWEVRAELHPGRSSRPARTSRPSTPRRSAASRGPRPGARAIGSGRSAWRDEDAPGPIHRQRRAALVRATLPVVTVGGEVAWVAGVAVSRGLPPRPRAAASAVLTRRRAAE